MSETSYQTENHVVQVQPVNQVSHQNKEEPFSYYWIHRILVLCIFALGMIFLFGAIAGVVIKNNCTGTKAVEFIWMFSHIILISLVFVWACTNPPNFGWDMKKSQRKKFYFYGFYFLVLCMTILFLNRVVDQDCTSDIGWLIQTILAYLWLIASAVTFLVYLLLKEKSNDDN